MDQEQVEQIRATKFNMAEFERLIHLIPETDPRSNEYGTLLMSIERFLYFANVIAEIQGVLGEDVTSIITQPTEIVQFNPPVAEDEKFEEPESVVQDPAPVVEEETKVEESKYEMADVKKAIQKARMDGKISSAKEWIKENFDVDGFSAIPASRYGEVMQKLKELG